MTTVLVIMFPVLWTCGLCLGLCSAAARPAYQSLLHGPSFMRDQNETRPLLGAGALLCLLLAAMLTAGCASRNYPAPVHGPTCDGTVQAIDLLNHRLTTAPLKPGQPLTSTYDASTKFWKNGIP